MLDINIVITGAAGQGVQTVGEILAKVVHRAGYYVFSWQEYESRIRGGSNSYRIRISNKKRNAPQFMADLLLPLDPKSKTKYISLRKPDAILIDEAEQGKGIIQIPFNDIATGEFGDRIFANTVALGALAAVVGLDLKLLRQVLEEMFEKKTEEIIHKNLQAAGKGYQLAETQCRNLCRWNLKTQKQKGYLITGNDTAALGAAAGGCRFIAAYPMTPSTGIITYLTKHNKELKIFSEQAEDEIAAINMAIGASYAGVRAMTATSGGGFALMNEGISLAGMMEIPVVILLSQRPGPATGLPTRTEQGDLLFAVRAGHGDFPKIVLAPSNPEQAFHMMTRAFDLAERYQTPVIFMSDQFLTSSAFSVEDLDMEQIQFHEYKADPAKIQNYKRYRLTKDGISPRLYPGQSRHLVCCDSDEHDEAGRITEDLENTRIQMVQKRLNKNQSMRKEMKKPESYKTKDAETVLISWGSSRQAVFEAIDKLRIQNRKVGGYHFTEIWPLPVFTFPAGKQYIIVESNATAQLGFLLQGEYGIKPVSQILRYDGYPLDTDYILKEMKNG